MYKMGVCAESILFFWAACNAQMVTTMLSDISQIRKNQHSKDLNNSEETFLIFIFNPYYSNIRKNFNLYFTVDIRCGQDLQ